MTRNDFIADHPIQAELESRGVRLIGNGPGRMAKCPFHKDGRPSFSVNIETGLWHCFAGCGEGSVIDLIAMFDGKKPGDVLKEAAAEERERQKPFRGQMPKSKPQAEGEPKGRIVTIYSYEDAFGTEAYQVCRMDPKDFRQRRQEGGKWVWNMQGVDRVLYRLPEITRSSTVAICEGEKDAETLTGLGWCGTTNVGGAGKWLDGYTETLAGKEVLIFGDNDDAGRAHVKKVFESIANTAKTVRIIELPSAFKDVTEYVQSFTEAAEAKACIQALIDAAQPFFKGVQVPIYSMAELEARYIAYANSASTDNLDLSKWLPSFRHNVRPLIAGEFMLIVGDTGTGKTAILQTIAIHARPLPSLLFEIELPAELLFERMVANRSKVPAKEVERGYAMGERVGPRDLEHNFSNIFICDEAMVDVEQIEAIILRSELKLGVRPKVVLVDYVQLVCGKGEDRYEKASHVAESLKRIAKRTRTIIVCASQRSRPSKQDKKPNVSLHDAKESGSLENSAGLVLGIWRDPDDKTLMHVKVLKNTKGTAGLQIPCNFDGERMILTERAMRHDYREEE